ncbi:MAG TPA: GNAT family N-acetyltransferase [Chitinophagaceae bacterium]|nr:GNAT family N-acetyltransferase [Chitinophagaceae bacterium]
MQVRLANENDLEQLLQIYNDIILNTTAVYQYQPHTLQMRREWLETKKREGFPVFVAEDRDNIVGFSTLGNFRNWQAYKYSVENSIYVASACRGKGVGKLLMPPLIDAAEKMDMHTIIAGIDATNEASLRLHKTFGFEEVAHFKEVGYKFKRWLDLKFLQLILKPPKVPSEE